MSVNDFLIREIKPEDNSSIEQIIKDIFPEFNIPLVGTAYEDIETPNMFESYQGENEVYFVIEENGTVYGGGGIKPLRDFVTEVCELQKMYFSPTIRGKGLGEKIFNKCIQAAKEFGFKKCYLESASQLRTAIHIYENNGFTHLEKPLGNTGHYSCGVWMIKDL
ncbi:GNAT family N-acetyltransferase [Flavobacteriaceae bacterium AH-315-B10]|nr:GNAT family N-acetyltransferase [Flavobacteriaceae bacterium AH-315-B10]